MATDLIIIGRGVIILISNRFARYNRYLPNLCYRVPIPKQETTPAPYRSLMWKVNSAQHTVVCVPAGQHSTNICRIFLQLRREAHVRISKYNRRIRRVRSFGKQQPVLSLDQSSEYCRCAEKWRVQDRQRGFFVRLVGQNFDAVNPRPFHAPHTPRWALNELTDDRPQRGD